MSVELEVKNLVIRLGWRHKNKPLEVRALGNSVDTIRRRATFRYGVLWAKAPSPALIEDMRAGTSPLQPTTQAYASDVDRIEIELEGIRVSE